MSSFSLFSVKIVRWMDSKNKEGKKKEEKGRERDRENERNRRNSLEGCISSLMTFTVIKRIIYNDLYQKK